MTKFFHTMIALAGLAFAAPLAAQQPVSLDADVQVAQEVDGETVYVEPDKVFPGDRLKFVTRYANGGGDTVEDFVITNPLPGAVALAQDGAFDVSVDGGKSFGPLAAQSVGLEDGSVRTAQASDVTHVRWTLARIAPGEAGEVSFFAQVK